MPLPEAAASHYRQVQRVQLVTMAAATAAWGRMGPDFDASWRTVGPLLVGLVGAAQGAAARSGAAYVPAALEQQGVAVDALAEVAPEAFAGVASDGRPLDSLLYGAVTTSKAASVGTVAPERALSAGAAWLEMAVRTQVTDAGRAAASVAVAARPRVGWTRAVNPPCCTRCAILAGKWFRFNDGFLRHPRCDCFHLPCVESGLGEVATDPARLFSEGRVTGLRAAQRQAVADGADPLQVVNADRGRSAGGMYTLEGTTKRGVANRARRAAGLARANTRPTVDAIYRYASDREDALTLLRQNGYLAP